MATAYEDFLDDVSSRLAASRLSQRLSRDSGTLGSIRSVRSSRIEKPRSNQNSPQGVQRRRTTSLAPAYTYYKPLPGAAQPQQYGVNVAQTYLERQTHRPVTWHPALFQQGQQFATSNPHMEASMITSELQPQHHQPLASYDRIASNMTGAYQAGPLQHIDYPLVPPNEESWNINAPDAFYAPSVDALQSYNATWYNPADTLLTQSLQQASTWTDPPSSESRLMQHPPGLIEDSTPPLQQMSLGAGQSNNEDKVLIGLGLYDPPATPPHPFAAAANQGKGLKLEEPWVPPSDPEDEDGEGEDDEDYQDSTTAAYGLPVESQNVVAQMQKQAQIYKDSQWNLQPQEGAGRTIHVQPGLEEQPFMFVNGEDVRDEWWYDPAAGMRAQEQGFGQGWLNA